MSIWRQNLLKYAHFGKEKRCNRRVGGLHRRENRAVAGGSDQLFKSVDANGRYGDKRTVCLAENGRAI